MSNYVFISYSTKDRSWAEQICKVLELNHISYWIAPESIPGGSNYLKEIPVAISECTAFMVLVTDNSVQSPWVLKELTNAINEKKLVIPLIVENTELPRDFAFLLNGVQHYMGTYKKDPTSAILDRIKIEIQREQQKKPEQEQQTQTKHMCPKCGCENINDDYEYVEKTAYEEIRDMMKNRWVYLMPFITSIVIWVVLCIMDLSMSEYGKTILFYGAAMSLMVSMIRVALIYYPIYRNKKNLQMGFIERKVSCCRCGYRFCIKTTADTYAFNQMTNK